jgi:hypothetical protein
VTGAPAPQPQPQSQPQSELRRRRDRLAEEVAELQWALGGLTYEMAIRDHFRLDVLLRRAAMLQERDAELAEVERLLHMQESSVAGSCPSCGAVRSRGAVYCWQCGAAMMERASVVSDAVTAELSTVVAREDGVPLPPLPAPSALSPERLLSSEHDGAPEHDRTQTTQLREPHTARPAERAERDAFGRPVSVGP